MFVAVLIAVLAAILFWLSIRLRHGAGLPEGEVIYSDTGAWTHNDESLRSKAHDLVGKPDYLVRTGRHVIPVEVKASLAPERPRPGHVLQLGAYCLLVEEHFGARPPYGIIR
ncbi:MAG: CRISPR-associated protein Cas4, partial [Thermoflexales bacterium]